MKSPATSVSLLRPGVLLALLAAGALLLALPLPAAAAGLALLALGLRIGVMIAALEAPPAPRRPVEPHADPHLRAA